MAIKLKHDATTDEKIAVSCALAGEPLPKTESEWAMMRLFWETPMVAKGRIIQGVAKDAKP
jgi:hypothetical protein